MQFTTFFLSALSIGSALAATTTTSSKSSTSTSTSGSTVVHVVRVGGANGSLTYSPNNIVAAVGDVVQFQFGPANHTVTQSTFANPCEPIALNSPGTVGFWSGFMPTTATATTTPTYSIVINNTTPIWGYCSQAKHCQAGMVFAINAVASSNKTVETFAALAAQATVNLPGDATSLTGATSSSSSGSSGTSGSSTTSAGTSQSTTSGASAVRAGQASMVGGLLALAVALLL